MPNLDRPRGFECKGVPLRANEYVAGAAVYPGDAVKQDNTGRVVATATGGSEATGAICGVALTYASAAGVAVMVADHPDQLFIVQASGANVDAQTDIGLNYSIVGTDPNSTYRISRQELKHDSGGTTATLPLKLVGVVNSPNNALGTDTDCIVMINNHQFGGGEGSTGV